MIDSPIRVQDPWPSVRAHGGSHHGQEYNRFSSPPSVDPAIALGLEQVEVGMAAGPEHQVPYFGRPLFAPAL